MHTSNRLCQDDFNYQSAGPTGTEKKYFVDLFPDYHPQDRIGIISPYLEDGILNIPGILLGLTTAFYDYLRTGSNDFFNYPQHFAFIGGQNQEVNTGLGPMFLEKDQIGAAWGWLDVWPETNWIIHPAKSKGMLDQLYRYQINRVFWPATLKPETVQSKLPPLVNRFLRNRLKSVWYYNTDEVNVEVILSETASHIVQESIDRLPQSLLHEKTGSYRKQPALVKNQFQVITPDDFLDAMCPCFNSD